MTLMRIFERDFGVRTSLRSSTSRHVNETISVGIRRVLLLSSLRQRDCHAEAISEERCEVFAGANADTARPPGRGKGAGTGGDSKESRERGRVHRAWRYTKRRRRYYKCSRRLFQKALQLAPNSATAHNNLGNAYVNQKKIDLAEKEFRTVLRLDPANRDGNYNLGVLLMAKGSPAEAIPHFERVRPTDVATTFNLITAYFQSKRTAEALRLATELSAQNKGDVKVHFNLGVLLASQAQYKAAQAELEKADALQPGTFEILFNLGQTLAPQWQQCPG